MDNSELSLRPSTQPLPPARTRPAAPHCNAHFGAQRGLRCLDQGLSVLHVVEDTVADLVQVLNSDVGDLLLAISDPNWVNAEVQQLLSLFQRTTTPVVPSPISSSCDLDSSAISLVI